MSSWQTSLLARLTKMHIEGCERCTNAAVKLAAMRGDRDKPPTLERARAMWSELQLFACPMGRLLADALEKLIISELETSQRESSAS